LDSVDVWASYTLKGASNWAGLMISGVGMIAWREHFPRKR
jgi:hypothetical protein